MQNKLERVIRLVYGRSKTMSDEALLKHPDEETIACYSEGRLSDNEAEVVKKHLLECGPCARAFAAGLKLEADADLDVPEELLSKVKGLVLTGNITILEIFLKLKEKVIELLSTNGDVLVEQEWVPAVLVRSRKIKTFKDELTILKEQGDIRLEIKITWKAKDRFNLVVSLKEKISSQPVKDARVSLLKDDIELESYVLCSGSVGFEDIAAGRYKIEISGMKGEIIPLVLDVTV